MKRFLTGILLCLSILEAQLTIAREFDVETGLVHMRARDYDPDTGRFLQEDPIVYPSRIALLQPERMHKYVYVANNPIIRIDPLGLDYVTFNGTELTWVFEAAGKETGRRSWAANSGTPDQFYPIPAGKYHTSAKDREINTPISAWGPLSYRLHESLVTRMLNRLRGRDGGFFVHGGYRPGTAGCIEFKDYAAGQTSLNEFDQLMQSYGQPIRLDVR